MTTIVDVAKKAGVSISTVSRVLNKSSHPVNKETQKKVLKAAEALNYSPSELARALISTNTSMLGLIARDVLDPYFAAIVRGAENFARSLGFLLIVCNSDRDPNKELDYVSALNGYRVDSIIFAGGGLRDQSYLMKMERLLKVIRARNCSIISIGWQEFPCARISNDEIAATKSAAMHLISYGHQRICYITGPDRITTTELRLKGYKQALEENNITFDSNLVVEGDYSIKAGLSAGTQVLRLNPLPSAVLASNDQMAIGCMRRFKDAGLIVPQDISIVGLNDIQASGWVDPPLTTVSLDLEELGARSVKCALKLRNGEIDDSFSSTVGHKMVIRDSVSRVKV